MTAKETANNKRRKRFSFFGRDMDFVYRVFRHRNTGCRAALASSSLRTGVVCGAVRTSSGRSAAIEVVGVVFVEGTHSPHLMARYVPWGEKRQSRLRRGRLYRVGVNRAGPESTVADARHH